jgi:hypothetical protein
VTKIRGTLKAYYYSILKNTFPLVGDKWPLS